MGEPSRTIDPISSPEDLEAAHREATREKVFAAERKVNYVRAAVIVFNSLVYALFLQGPDTIPWLAWTVVGVANAYWIVVTILEPYRRIEAMLTSYVTSIGDATLITLWILATGGFGSPFHTLWYVSIVAVAFRYGLRETVIVSGFYTACYVGMLGAIGELAGNLVDVAVRSGYIFLVGGMSSLVSQEAHEQTEEKVRMRKLMEQARNAETRFRRLIESAPDAILISDERGRIAIANSRAEHLFGMPREEIVETRVEDLMPDIASALNPSRAQRSTNGHPGSLQPFSGEARRKDGGTVPVEASVAPLTTREGSFLSFIVRDVADRKAAEHELEERNRELARSNEELQQFAYVASHDLQEPLRMVSSYVQLLERRYGDQLGPDAAEFIDYATEGVDRMRDLIRDLLAFSQVGTLGSEFEPVDLEDVADHVLATLAPAIEDAGARVHVGDLPTVVADRSQIEQLFQNLVSNALKFHRDGTPNVWVRAQRDGNEWIVSVRDDGIGIDPDYQEKIFVIFQRLHNRSAYPGTGIGLAICRKIVESHGGRIWVESPPDEEGVQEGSVFRFTLPVLRTGQTSRAPADQVVSSPVPRTRLDFPGESPGDA